MSDFATLIYTAAAVGPVSLSALVAAMSNVDLGFKAITDMTGCVEVSDTTTTSGGEAQRIIVFGLTYSCFLQFNANNLTPPNSKTRQYYVITTSGPVGNVGDLLYDDGSNKGRVSKITAVNGRTIITASNTPSDFTGGTVSLINNHQYTWSGAAWVDNGASKVFRNGFQNNFPVDAGSQAMPFNNLYTHALGAVLGSVIAAANPSIT